MRACTAFAFLSLALASRVTVSCPSRCSTDLDCSLNGACDVATGQCLCDAAWGGPCCTSLALLPVAPSATGYLHSLTSTWGGNIIVDDDAEAEAHMWIAEMAPNGTGGDPGAGSCGLTTWGENSQVVHVAAASPLGPYFRREVAVPVWSHNPLVRKLNGSYVMYHIGAGSGGAPGKGYCAANGTSPCGEQSFDECASGDPCAGAAVAGFTCAAGFCGGDARQGDCGADLAEPSLACSSYVTCAPLAAAACAATPGCRSFALSAAWGFGRAKLFSAGDSGLTPNSQWVIWVAGGRDMDMYGRAAALAARPEAPPGSCNLDLHVAASPTGPWLPVPNVSVLPCGSNNPAPWLHPNGTLYIVFTEWDMGLWRADSWRGPYTLVTMGACGGGEDPSLYLDKRGAFHCLFHRSPFSNPDLAIGHAFSVDGLSWHVADEPAANSTIAFEAPLGTIVHGKRERPHLFMNAQGDLAALVTGVCIDPACDPRAPGGVRAGVDCSAAAQYYRCDANSPEGWTDRTYTLVQAIATPTLT